MSGERGDDRSDVEGNDATAPGELPYGFDTTAGGTAAATTRPDASWLLIRVDPSRRSELFQFYMLGFREELMHGERGRFGLTRNVRLLRRQSYEALYRMLAGEIEPATARQRIEPHWEAAERIRDERLELLETIDQFLTRSAMQDPAIVEHGAQEVIDDPVERADLLEEFYTLVENYESDVPLEGVYQDLVDIEAQYGTSTAVAVADVALDVPHLVSPLDAASVTGVSAEELSRDVIEPSEIDLVERFDRATEALDETGTRTTGLGTDEIVDRIEGELAEGTDRNSRALRAVPMPLLDVPASVASDAGAGDVLADIDGVSSLLAQVLTAAFTSVGTLGGAIYRTGERPDAWEWLVNPLVADRRIDAYPDGFPDGGRQLTYGEYWQLNLVADVLVSRLMDAESAAAFARENDCPLCRHSHDRHCGDDTCQTTALRSSAADLAPAFLGE